MSRDEVDDSNALLLPPPKKKKSKKDSGKGSKRRSRKEAPPPAMSKSKQRKLKQMEAEKERKLLHCKSIMLLEKYKIRDVVHSVLHSSGTIGQAETMREKRRRAVQLSKLGLEVPDGESPFHKCKKRREDVSMEPDVTGSLSFDERHTVSALSGSELLQPISIKSDDLNENLTSKEGQLKPMSEGLEGSDYPILPSTSVEDKGISINMHGEENKPTLVSSRREKGTDTMLKAVDSLVFGCESHVNITDGFQKHVTERPIVVHVSRPNEVEETRKDIPIVMMEQEIMEAVKEHSVILICGETGCGKTTQVPQFLYEAGFGSGRSMDKKGIIAVTQPRRVAVLSTAKRVCYELGLCIGKDVGFQVRHDKVMGNNCSIKFMTDGILLREVQSDFLLKRYSVIILDEAHERSLNTDILIGMLSRIVKLRQTLYVEQQEKVRSGMKIDPENQIAQLKLILMSATLCVDDFVSNKKLFTDAPPVIQVPARQYPVTIHFSKNTKEDYLDQAYRKVMSIHKRLPPGGILVFVTGQREVEFLCKKLRKASQKLILNISRVKAHNVATSSMEDEMKEINEAFDLGGCSGQESDLFCSFEETDEQVDSYSSDLHDSDMNSDSEDEDSLEVSGNMNEAVDIFKGSVSLSYLKDSFEALAGSKSDPINEVSSAIPEPHSEPIDREVSPLYVLPLYAMLPAPAQLQVFEEIPEGERLVVVATNVAETSLTIPGIRYVVDTGKEKVKNYNHANGMATYDVQWISKASAAQRAGRSGRTGPGHCYRLYSAAAFSKDDLFAEFSLPEISVTPVDGVVLLMKYMCIDKVLNFPFPTPPDREALIEAEHCLKALEALDSQSKLTPIGKAMAQFPMSPRHSRMLLTVVQIIEQVGFVRPNLVLGYAVATAAALSFPNPLRMQDISRHERKDGFDEENMDTKKIKTIEKQRQKQEKVKMREARMKFSNPCSDALTVAYALQSFELAENPLVFCNENSIHLKTMEEMSKLRRQLLQLVYFQSRVCQEFSWQHGSIEEVESSWKTCYSKCPLSMSEEDLLRQAICAGWADRVAKRVRIGSDLTDKDRKIHATKYQSCALKDTTFLHRQSSVSLSAPDFLVYSELLCTKRPYLHGVTSVKVDWLVRFAGSLCSFSAPLTDPKPYYDPISDQALCWVSPTFGPHNWELPLHSIPIKNEILRVSVFACGLLEGKVLPCMRSAQKFLAASPNSILRQGALGQRRVGDLLSRLKIGSKIISSREMLNEIWRDNPQYLHFEVQQWFQDKFLHHFEEIWEQMHNEVCLSSHELYPKRAKKDRKLCSL